MAQTEFGATAWGRSWVRSIERTDRVPNQKLPKARSLARNQNTNITLATGAIASVVVDGSARHDVSVLVPRWDERETATAQTILASGHPNSAVGDLPDHLVGALIKAGVPVSVALADVAATCTCRSRARPCVHVFAALYALVLLIDERPVTALEIRADGLHSDAPTGPDWVPLTTVSPSSFYNT